MAIALSVGDFVKCRIWCATVAAYGQASVNTTYYKVAAAGSTPATDLDVATTLDALVEAGYKNLISTVAEYRGVQSQILAQTKPWHARFAEQFTVVNNGNGNVTGSMLPPQTCGLISIQTGLAGVAYRGRIYMPFPGADDDSGGGSPTTGYATRLAAMATNLTVGLAVSVSGRTATLARVLFHGKDKTGFQPDPTPVLSGSSSLSWATQRRRGAYGRQNKSPI